MEILAKISFFCSIEKLKNPKLNPDLDRDKQILKILTILFEKLENYDEYCQKSDSNSSEYSSSYAEIPSALADLRQRYNNSFISLNKEKNKKSFLGRMRNLLSKP